MIEGASLEFLLTVDHLSMVASQSQSEFGQMEFLLKFKNMKHRLKSLYLTNHYCVGDIPKIWGNLVKTSTLESLHVSPTALLVELNDTDLVSITIGERIQA
jgi:hypothetical protein